MSHRTRIRRLSFTPTIAFRFALAITLVLTALSSGSASAQERPSRVTRGGVPALPPPAGPVVINTDVVPEVRVVPVVIKSSTNRFLSPNLFQRLKLP